VFILRILRSYNFGCVFGVCAITLLVNIEEGLLYLYVYTLNESLPLKTEFSFASLENM